MKEEILAKTRPLENKPGRYQPDDQLLSFLKALLVKGLEAPFYAAPESASQEELCLEITGG